LLFGHPIPNFVEREELKTIERKLKSKEATIFYIHGFPGCGRSQLVRKLAASFPFDEAKKVFVVYLINCNDGTNSLAHLLSKLIDKLYSCNLVDNVEECGIAKEGLAAHQTAKFTEILANTCVPVLLIIENLEVENELDLMNDLLSSVNMTTTLKKSCDVFLCITSRSKHMLDCKDLQNLQRVHLKGFLEVEGFKFLGVNPVDTEQKRQAAREILKVFNYMPLGLAAVKETCRRSRISFEKYIQTNQYTFQKEPQHLKEKYGSYIEHLFPVLVALLRQNGVWDTAAALSFFHHDNIPQLLVGKVKETQRSVDDRVFDQEIESGEFITSLENLSFCEVTGETYADTKISFHQVVFMAVQNSLDDKEKKRALRHAILALASLVRKDISNYEDKSYTSSMIPHLKSVLDFANQGPTSLSHEDQSIATTNFVVSMAILHLKEVYGNIMKYIDARAAEKILMESSELIVEEVNKRSQSRINFIEIVEHQGCRCSEIAVPICVACLAAGVHLRNTSHYLEKYSYLIADNYSTDAANLGSFPSHQAMKSEILPIEAYCHVFFVERLVSLLYTLSRTLLFVNSTEKVHSKALWIADVTQELCLECRRMSRVYLSFLRDSASNRINVRLKRLSKIADQEMKKTFLFETKKIAETNLERHAQQKDIVFYQNGAEKPKKYIDFDEMINRRFMSQINSKLLSFYPAGSDGRRSCEETAQANYGRLHELAVSYMHEWTAAAEGLVYCGKYMAGLGKYKQAIEHIRYAFTCTVVQQERKRILPSACLIYAKVVLKGHQLDQMSDAVDKCKKALKYDEDIQNCCVANKLRQVLSRLLITEEH